MKYFLEHSSRRTRILLLAAILTAVSAVAELPSWIRNLEAGSAIEAAFFRMMSLPGGPIAFRRPPAETRPALGELIKSDPHNAELYSLRAMEDERQLDFSAAEADWKAYLTNSSDKPNAEFALADFYHRRLRPGDEIRVLESIANAPPIAAEKLTPVEQQRSWQAFERIFGIIQAQGMAKDVSIAQYRAWITRYPQEQSLYARFLQFLITQKDYAAAGQLIADYRKHFPADQVFPVKARAMVEYRQGSVREGLSVYEQSFEPLWDPELVKSYFDLLRETQNLRRFRDNAHAALEKNPEDLNATARLFYYYQQQGKVDVAQQTIADLRAHKEASKSPWKSQELFTCARLLEDIHAYPESARYYFALYNSKGMPDAQEVAIAGLTNILLTAPETPIRLGSEDLSMYRDIATVDQGPGYLNGILSLILNTTRPASQYADEEQRAVPYFHRSRAAELLALLDTKFPNYSRRAALHAQLLEFYSASAETDAVIQGGRDFLATFPNASERTSVALLMADAYARKGDSANEFAIYDSVLQELAKQAQNVPLGSTTANDSTRNYGAANNAKDEDEESENTEDQSEAAAEDNATPRQRASESFKLSGNNTPSQQSGPRSPEYARVLERYLARLAETKQVLPALALLRREIDRNPDDPGLYERLALFVQQNQLGSQEEEVYKRAIARFPNKSWYDKLARFYLRQKRAHDFEQLTRDAVKTFSGSDLEHYFDSVVYGGSPQLYLQLNLYAHQRFPHNPVFVRNLLGAYRRTETWNPTAWEALLRQHWFEEDDLRNQFFEFLSSHGTLESELAAVRRSDGDSTAWMKNPAAATYIAYGDLWRSHFETSAPVLKVLAEHYPAEREIADTASSVYRSLAYFEPADTDIAVQIEDNLLKANPGDTDLMARIGDTYADRNLFAKAAPYWERIPQVAPGQSSGYLDAATIYWDYFDFDNALRQLHQGRERLGNPDLYAYEEGAIYENQRDYPRAVDEYVRGALSSKGSAEARLLQLARRPKLREIVDRSTAGIAAGANPSMSAVNLRVAVLETQNRKQDVAQLLDSIISSTTSVEQAEDIETLAEQKSLEDVREHALEKQAVLTTDPVTRLRIRYSLIRLYENRKDFADAQKNVEALYRDNPKILGVVRATVDFYWRMKMSPQAIDVLLKASKEANPDLATQFSFEAARKLTDVRRFSEARDLLNTLLNNSPFNGEYLAAMADTYAQAGDDPGLQKFYLQEIDVFRADTSLSADAKKAQIATLRRGLIPSLTRMKNYSGAVDQYIELINKYPEDESLVAEAALYALRYQRQQQLEDFYAKTVAKSPRDYRWSMVLARIQTNLEEYPAAIATYAKAIAVRPDRSDLLIARADLEERLMRFDDAATDYERIYQLAYKAPQWMEKIATVRARQGKTDETVAALNTALITGRPENPSNYFEVARRLEGWGMLTQARGFAEKGMNVGGGDILTVSENDAGVRTYVRIMTRLRQYSAAYATLQKALEAASSELPALKDQVAKQGLTGITDSEWRENRRRVRTEFARNEMRSALQEMGSAENLYYTPEERLAFAHFAETKRSSMTADDVEKFAIPLAESGALAYQEALWRYELLMQRRSTLGDNGNLMRYVELQRQRGLFAELGSNLEKFARVVPQTQTLTPLLAASDAYQAAGDEANELRVLAQLSPAHLDNTHLQRLFKLLLARDPQQLVRLASLWNTAWGDQAAAYIVTNGGTMLSHAAVQARAPARPAVWGKAYNALVGLYNAEPSPEVRDAFVGVLGDEPIGARIGKPIDRNQRLAGNIWFYYGSRYGDYLGTTKQGQPEDFLPAVLEESPASPPGYLTLADYYAGSGDVKRAIIDYNHTLELSPNRPAVIDSLAVAYYRQSDRQAALAQWKRAFKVLSDQINGAHVPETFWSDFGRTCDQLASRKMFVDAKPEAEAIVRTYLRHNGNYRSNAVLHSVYSASGGTATATEWLVSLSSSASDPAMVLSDIADVSWIPLSNRGIIYQHVLQLKRDASAKLTGIAHDNAEQEVGAWEVRWIDYLVHSQQYAPAAAAIDALPQQVRASQAAALVPLELQAAAKLGTLDAKITEYRTDPARAPTDQVLTSAAQQLFTHGDKQSARKLLEYVFAHEIEEHQLNAANFLGLAEIRLADGDTPGALELLHRLVLVVGSPLQNLDPAAALLERTGHNAEAVEFLDRLLKSAPWDASSRLRLAKARLASGQEADSANASLVGLAAGDQTTYALRVQASITLAGRPHTTLGSAELDLLAGNSAGAPVASADSFYFYEARILAAQRSNDARTKVQLLTHCITDFPHRDEARIPLFRAASSANMDEFALAAIRPVLQQQLFTDSNQTGSIEQIVNAEDESEPAEDSEDADTANLSSLTTTRLSRAQQSELVQLIGDVMLHLDELNQAQSYYETARRLEKSHQEKTALSRKIADVKNTLRIQRANSARRPILHADLEQDRVVRPRLVARAGVAGAAAKGTVKP